MPCCHVLGATLIFVFSVISVGLLVACGVSYDWFILAADSPNQSRIGLWRSCETINNVEMCRVDDDVLKFPDTRRGRISHRPYLKELLTIDIFM